MGNKPLTASADVVVEASVEAGCVVTVRRVVPVPVAIWVEVIVALGCLR